MFKQQTDWIVLLIVLMGSIVCIWQLDRIPPGIHIDEADMGYAAYSIMTTGKTQYGTFNPLALPEFNGGTFPPLYSYVTMPFFALFGLNIIAERMPAALFGMASVTKTVDYERQLSNAPLWLSSIFHNKATVIIKRYLSSYMHVFSLEWFFINGHGNLLESFGRHGMFYLFELPFFFIGIFCLFQKHARVGVLLLIWLFTAHIPGAITTGEFYPYRSILMQPVPIIFSAIGLVWFWEWSKQQKLYREKVMQVLVIVISLGK